MAVRGTDPHPDSVIDAGGGRVVQIKIHRGLWSGDYPENSLPAIEECYKAAVARAEIDLRPLGDADFLVMHDPEVDGATTGTGAVADLTRAEAHALRLRFGDGVSGERPPLFSEVAALIREQQYPTLLELDLPAHRPLPWPRAEELARLIEPVKDRVILNGPDWNLRRVLRVDPTLPVAFDPATYLDWLPEGHPEVAELGLPRGAYGYLDAHPLARERFTTVQEYLEERLAGIAGLIPGVREAHLRLAAFERMLDDGVEGAAIFHRLGLLLDVWTLNAGTPHWRERLARALTAGVDVVTSDTPRELAAAGREIGRGP